MDAVVQSSESIPWTFSQEQGRYVRIDKPLSALAIAIAFPKSSADLRREVVVALRDAVADGTYAAALAKHGLTENSDADALSNPAP